MHAHATADGHFHFACIPMHPYARRQNGCQCNRVPVVWVSSCRGLDSPWDHMMCLVCALNEIVHRRLHMHACAYQIHAFPSMKNISATPLCHVQQDDNIGRATETTLVYVALHPLFTWKEDGNGRLKRVIQGLGLGPWHEIGMNMNIYVYIFIY